MRIKKLSRYLVLGIVPFMVACQTAKQDTGTELVLELVDHYQGEYIVGAPIDIGYFFYCNKRGSGTITVTYKNYAGREVTDTVTGTTFWPQNSGTHKFVYKVGDKSIEKTIEVVDQKPTINIDTYAFFTTPDEKIYYTDIYNEISVDYTPSSATLEVSKVEWAAFDFNLNHEPYQFTEVTSKAKYFDGSKCGLYRIYVDAVNGARKASGVVNAVISNNEKDGNALVLKLNDKYCSNRVVINSEKDNVFMLPAARHANASYVVWGEETVSGTQMAIKFKGKQIPSFGLFTQPNPTTSSFSQSALTDGYVMSFEQRSTSTYTIVRGGTTMEYKRAYQPEWEFALDDLESDKYYLFSWSFKTVYSPDKHEEIPWLHSIWFNFREIYDINTPEETYSQPIFDLQSAGGWWDKYETTKGYTVFYSSALQDITFEVVDPIK